MKSVISAQRLKFEEETFPHLEAIWGTALWLTTRWSQSEQLVLETMARAYHVWDSPNGSVSGKARLFKVLLSEFARQTGGKKKVGQLNVRPEQTSFFATDGGQQYSGASVIPQELSQLGRTSHVSVKGAIARLEITPRLVMILWFRERFSYREIAYIMDIGEDSVKSILSEYRRHIPKYLVRRAETIAQTGYSDNEYRNHAESSEDG